MTKKHYATIAAALKNNKDNMTLEVYTKLVNDMLHTIRVSNPQFDRDKSWNACFDN